MGPAAACRRERGGPTIAARMSMLLRVCVVLTGLVGETLAGGVAGRLELQPPERPPLTRRGFLDRVENQLTPVRKVNAGPHLAVVLEGDASKPLSAGQVPWELGGEAFGKPVLVVPVGAEILVTNTSGSPRTLVALEDPKLLQAGPINPNGTKSFRVTEAKAYTIVDKDVPHLRGKVLVVATPYYSLVEVSDAKPEVGTFKIADVAEGSYKLRVFYRDGWIDRPDEPVTVSKGNVDVAVKIPPGFPLRK
jgi:hypothetical protein